MKLQNVDTKLSFAYNVFLNIALEFKNDFCRTSNSISTETDKLNSFL